MRWLLKIKIEVEDVKGERLKIRMDRRAEKDVEANSKKCRLKWTVRGQLLAL